MPGKSVVPHSAAMEQFQAAFDAIPWATEEADSAEAVSRMIEDIFSVEKGENEVDEVLGGAASTAILKLAGEVIVISSAVKRQGDKQIYLQLTANRVDDWDNEFLISTGSQKICAKISKLFMDGKLPFKCRVFVGTAKSSGNNFYDLLPVD